MSTARDAYADGAPAVGCAMGPGEWGTLLALSVLWGASFFFVGVAVDDLPVLTIVALRVGLAAVALWVFVALTGRPLPRDPAVWRAFLAMGLINNVVPFSLIVWGQQSIASGLASILNATTPLFTVLAAGVLLPDERPTPLKLAGVAIGFVGVAVTIGPGAASGVTGGLAPSLAILGAALSYALAGVYGRRFARMGVDPVVAATGQVTASALVLAPVALLVDRPWTLAAPAAATWAAVGGLALLSTALAYGLYFRLLERSGATNLLLVTFLIPVSAMLLGVLVLGERIGGPQVAGMVVIGLGLAAIDGRPVGRARRLVAMGAGRR